MANGNTVKGDNGKQNWGKNTGKGNTRTGIMGKGNIRKEN